MQKNIAVKQLTNNAAEVIIYGYIGEEVLSGDVIKAIRALEPLNTKISFRINSGGGSIFEGLAIFNAIKNCKATTEAFIDGLAASMGSVIAMACDKVYMSKYAMFMTHRAKGGSNGSAQEMRNTAALMENLEITMATIYAGKTGMTPEAAQEKYLGKEDRWLGADEALAEKIIDGIYDGEITEAPPVTMRTEKEVCGFYASTYNLEKFNTDMKELKLTADQALALGLTAADTDAVKIQAVVDALVAKAKRVDTLELELKAEKAKTTGAEAKVIEMQNAATAEKITGLVKEALDGKKITVEVGAQLTTAYAGKPTELKALLDAMPVFTSITNDIKNAQGKADALKDKTWDELDKSGELEGLKASNLDLFKAKYKAEFGKEYE